jgi:hypothetical protein
MHERDEKTERTLLAWQPRSSRRLTQEDARQIAVNMTSFFQILGEWDRKERERNPPPPGDQASIRRFGT